MSIPAAFGAHSPSVSPIRPSFGEKSPSLPSRTNNNIGLSRQIAEKQAAPKEPTRLELIARCRRGKDFAGESTDPEPSSIAGNFKVTSGVIGYFGHLPGVQSSFGTGFPNQIKKSTKYVEEREKHFGKSMPKLDDDGRHDKWGNLKERPEELRRNIGNLYLQASKPGLEIDASKGVGVPVMPGMSMMDSVSPTRGGVPPSPGSAIENTYFRSVVDQKMKLEKQQQSPNRSQAFLAKSEAVQDPLSVTDPAGVRGVSLVKPSQPEHIAGYKGFQPGARDVYGEPYNRMEGRLHAAKLQNAQAQRYGPNRGVGGVLSGSVGNNASGVILESESQKFLGSYEQHNLIVGNRNAVSH